MKGVNFAPFASYPCDYCDFVSGKTKIYLLKPTNYMNHSGYRLNEILDSLNCDVDSTLVVHDDISFSVGKLKISRAIGNGGHNGVASVSNAIGSNFTRLRLGIGSRPNACEDLANHVLSEFHESELKMFD